MLIHIHIIFKSHLVFKYYPYFKNEEIDLEKLNNLPDMRNLISEQAEKLLDSFYTGKHEA